jgi:hypothetical protein
MNILSIVLNKIRLPETGQPYQFEKSFSLCGERGIRTLDTLLRYTHFPGVLLQPLGHLSFLRIAKVEKFLNATEN